MHSEYKVFGSFIFYYYYFYFCSLIQLDFIVSLPEILEICPTKKKKKKKSSYMAKILWFRFSPVATVIYVQNDILVPSSISSNHWCQVIGKMSNRKNQEHTLEHTSHFNIRAQMDELSLKNMQKRAIFFPSKWKHQMSQPTYESGMIDKTLWY